jgi:hypothetical protein
LAEYSDLTQIAKLQAEQLQIEQALLLLEEHDGIVAAYTVSAPPQPAGMMGSPPMPVHIATVEPKQKNLMASVHASLVQRFNDINQELRDLGVTGGPPDHAQGGGPSAELHPARQ